MSDLRYRLVLITHGDAPALDRVLASFVEHVTPAPVERVCVIDGPGRLPPVEPLGDWQGTVHGEQLGFCEATRTGWQLAAEPGVKHCLWLENDFIVTRPLDLRPLAAILDVNPTLAQMQLMRGAVNADELYYGGLFESRLGQYESREAKFVEDTGSVVLARYYPWQEHRSYLTTNVSLMRRQFMADNPWPDYESECEGRFGIDLVARGYSFGVWGSGEPWTEHIGVRSGHGY